MYDIFSRFKGRKKKHQALHVYSSWVVWEGASRAPTGQRLPGYMAK